MNRFVISSPPYPVATHKHMKKKDMMPKKNNRYKKRGEFVVTQGSTNGDVMRGILFRKKKKI